MSLHNLPPIFIFSANILPGESIQFTVNVTSSLSSSVLHFKMQNLQVRENLI